MPNMDPNSKNPHAPGEHNISDSRGNCNPDTSSTALGNFKLISSLLFSSCCFLVSLSCPLALQFNCRMQILAFTITAVCLSLCLSQARKGMHTHAHTLFPPPHLIQPLFPTPFLFEFLPFSLLLFSPPLLHFLSPSYYFTYSHFSTLLTPLHIHISTPSYLAASPNQGHSGS